MDMDIDTVCEIEDAIDGEQHNEDVTMHEVVVHCFTRLAEIAEAEAELSEEKKRYRAWLEAATQEYGEIKAAGYKATWTPPSESVSYPTKQVKEWVIRNADADFITDFVKSCQQTSVRNGSLRITKQK
jgi:hypothetical protein